MTAKRRIAILLHEKDRYPKSAGHFIWSLCDIWREWGIEIVPLKGTKKYVEADLLIPHLDTTILPGEYVEFFKKYPHVVNRRLQDISKRLISRNLLTQMDSWDGPVIVKTNFNNGAIPDVRLHGHKIAFSTKPRKSFWDMLLNRKAENTNQRWGKINCMNPNDYQIFPSIKHVPEGVFTNESLVVERFLPEYKNGIYYLRVYKFFGDRAYCAQLGSHHPIVKQKNIISREEVSIPDEVVAYRHELGMDYGKLDFVIRDGRVIVFDVNRTPGLIKSKEQMKANALKLAPGINSLFLPDNCDKQEWGNAGQSHKLGSLSKPA
jgi:hypothetical protein